MKVYYIGNIDGTNVALVAAKNQTEAAKILDSSVSSLRFWGFHSSRNYDWALAHPGVVFYRPIGQSDLPWRTSRYTDRELRA